MPTLAHSTAPPLTAAARRSRWWVLAVVLAASVLNILDSTVTTIAAPAIARDLHGGQALFQWLGTSYTLALGVLLVPGGRLGDRYGRRRLFLTGCGGFVLASVGCGLAVSPGMLIAARLVQGGFGALLIPQGFGILGAVFPREEIGKAFSVFAPALGASSVGGPILAGVLLDADVPGLGWRAVFLVNLVLGGGALLAAVRLLPRDDGSPGTPVDAAGSAFLGAAMLGLLYGLTDGARAGWTVLPALSLAAGAAAFALFCRRQLTAPRPLITPSLLRNRGFTAGLVLGVAFFAAVSGLIYVLSLFMQYGQGRGPLHTALGMVPNATGIVLASIAAHRLLARFGRRLVTAGLVTTLVGVLWLLLLVRTSGTGTADWALVPPVFTTGLGLGTCFGSLYTITIGDIDPSEAGSASGSLSAVQQLANAIGSALVTTVYFHALGAGAGAGAVTRGGAGDDVRAMTVALSAVAATVALSCALTVLLPRTPPTRPSPGRTPTTRKTP